jgi:hypothetical protein
MKMEAVGLVDHLINHLHTDGSCLKKIARETHIKKVGNENKKSLTLKSLSGAFLILGIGYALAVLVFITEICCRHMKKKGIPHTVNRNKNIKQMTTVKTVETVVVVGSQFLRV